MTDRSCGLYRTGKALTSAPELVPEGTLVFFHNHSEQGVPVVLLPETNTDNVWSFGSDGHPVRDDAFLDALVPLLPEGFYVASEDFTLPRGRNIREQTLVQLGYNRLGIPIVFLPERQGNSLAFPARGFRADGLDLDTLLWPVSIPEPEPHEARVLH